MSVSKMRHFDSISATIAIVLALIASNGRADDSHIVLYNEIDNCKSNEYFDANYFMCRLCDPQLNLVPSENGRQADDDSLILVYLIRKYNLINVFTNYYVRKHNE